MRSILAFRNRQRTRSLHLPLLRRITQHLLREEFKCAAYELGFHFVDSSEMAGLNQKFLQHEGSTDVITFEYDDENSRPQLHGEIFISIPDALKQARAFGTTWQSEVVRYIIHGLLHLRGHDDLHPKARQAMKREENQLLRRIAARFTLGPLARTRNSKLRTRNPS